MVKRARLAPFRNVAGKAGVAVKEIGEVVEPQASAPDTRFLDRAGKPLLFKSPDFRYFPSKQEKLPLLVSRPTSCGELGESFSDLYHDAVPVTRSELSELSEGRIPGTVISIEQPSPTRVESVEQPHRLA